jgi:hypothetical protein
VGQNGKLLSEASVIRRQPFSIACLFRIRVYIRIFVPICWALVPTREKSPSLLSGRNRNRGSVGGGSFVEWHSERHTIDEVLTIAGNLVTTAQPSSAEISQLERSNTATRRMVSNPQAI